MRVGFHSRRVSCLPLKPKAGDRNHNMGGEAGFPLFMLQYFSLPAFKNFHKTPSSITLTAMTKQSSLKSAFEAQASSQKGDCGNARLCYHYFSLLLPLLKYS